MASISEHTDELDGQPLFWRTAPSATGRGARPVRPRRPDEQRRLGPVPRADRRPRAGSARASGAPASAATATSRWRGTSASSGASSSTPGSTASGSSSTTGAPSGCCGRCATPSASSGSSSSTRVTFLPGYRWHRTARIWRTRGLGELFMGVDEPHDAAALAARGARRPRPDADGLRRRDHGPLRPWHPARDPAPLPLQPGGHARGGRRRPRARSTARRSSCGATATPTSPPRFADAYAAALGGPTTVRHVPDAGHWPWLERPELIDEIAAFLDDDDDGG